MRPLIDRLADAGLVERAPGPMAVAVGAADRRGRRAARRVSDQRLAYLASLLAGLSPAETGALTTARRVMGDRAAQRPGVDLSMSNLQA